MKPRFELHPEHAAIIRGKAGSAMENRTHLKSTWNTELEMEKQRIKER